MSSLSRRWLLTGGIGSGKSTVRRLLEGHGLRTVDADSVGHQVLVSEAREAVAERWPEVVGPGGVDRAALARIVFADRDQLRALEGITHPLIFGRIEADLNHYGGYAVVEVPLLHTPLDWPVMVVDVVDSTRRERALVRGLDPDDLDRRIAMQPARAEWLAVADLVIPNHATLADLEDTVAALVTTLFPPL